MCMEWRDRKDERDKGRVYPMVAMLIWTSMLSHIQACRLVNIGT